MRLWDSNYYKPSWAKMWNLDVILLYPVEKVHLGRDKYLLVNPLTGKAISSPFPLCGWKKGRKKSKRKQRVNSAGLHDEVHSKHPLLSYTINNYNNKHSESSNMCNKNIMQWVCNWYKLWVVLRSRKGRMFGWDSCGTLLCKYHLHYVAVFSFSSYQNYPWLPCASQCM